jgi:MoxR-like ATPase
MIYNQQRNEFVVRKGPIFANFILADEINRAPAKVQSALLEAMQERQVTIGDATYKLEEPFLVLATQNPLEQEGTYPLPEAQVDRFIMKVIVDYPKMNEEQLILRQNIQGNYPDIKQVVSVQEVLSARELTKQIYMDEKIEQYILDIVFATRQPGNYKLEKLNH